MLESYPGAINSAYYHTNAGSWQDTVTTLNTNFVPTGAQEGDRLELSLTLAPEYYVDAQGNVRWDDLKAGASMRIPMTVDNTAPELLDVNLSLMGSTMTVKARDNRYVAGVVLYNASGTKSLAMTGAMQDIQPGKQRTTP